MKHIKTFIFLTLTMLAFGANAQSTKVDKFLNEYETFVNEVISYPFESFHGDTLQHVEHLQHKYLRRYRWLYDDRMSIEQLERFNKLRGRFNRKMTALNNRRRLAATKGRIQGYFEKPSWKRDTIAE